MALHGVGRLVIAMIVVLATVAMRPSVRMTQRFLDARLSTRT